MFSLPSLPLHSRVSACPILGAIFAPLSVLFALPALAEPWIIKIDPLILLSPNKTNSIVEPLGYIVLSAGFNIFANLTPPVRYSTSTRRWWRVAMRMSFVVWTADVCWFV